MNRIEALQAAFMIAGPNVTAEEHIQYAEFLLGDQNVTYIKDWISAEDTKLTCDDPREYNPDLFVYKVGEEVFKQNDDLYHVGAVARDWDRDVWVKTEDGWELYFAESGELSVFWTGIEDVARFEAVFVA